MSNQPPEQSTYRVLWWARNFGRPLQAEFTTSESDMPDDFNQLLEMADRRMLDNRSASSEA
ncbi:MAG: hypothetical protein Q8R82_03775 [Hyphomonadaceae bacterium]|nr:hypothetical protein [Hyphomonadaceae bacterium]